MIPRLTSGDSGDRQLHLLPSPPNQLVTNHITDPRQPEHNKQLDVS
jgi:hypothetical protein